MKPCKCNGNNSLRTAIGSIRCECGGELQLAQVLQRIISRLNECDDQDSNLIQGLVAAGMGTCDICGEWFNEKNIVRAGDRATCERCFNPEHFCREDDDDEAVDFVLPQLMARIAGTSFMDRLPHDRITKALEEPFLTYYKNHSRIAQ